MLSYNIHDVESHAVTVRGELGPDDPVWQEGDFLPAGAVHVAGRLSAAGAGRFYFSGRIEGTANVACRRCLVDTTAAVGEDVHVIFADDGATEDDPDVYRLPARTPVIDLRPAVREQWLLGVPAFAVCREECRGLCTRCGSDLNAGDCACPPETDSRLEVLHKLQNASDDRP